MIANHMAGETLLNAENTSRIVLCYETDRVAKGTAEGTNMWNDIADISADGNKGVATVKLLIREMSAYLSGGSLQQIKETTIPKPRRV